MSAARKAVSQRALWSALRARAKGADLLDAESEHHLLASAKRGDAGAIDALTRSHMRLVVDVASHFARSDLDPDDLVSEGTVGLLEAIERFDATQGARLCSYARWWIRARVHSYSRTQRSLVRPPSTRLSRRASSKLNQLNHRLRQQLGREPSRAELASALNADEEELTSYILARNARDLAIDDPSSEATLQTEEQDPERALAAKQASSTMRSQVQRALSQLSSRERKIFRSQFPDAQCTHAQLGIRLGVSRQRASQLVAAVRDRLRDELASLAS